MSTFTISWYFLLYHIFQQVILPCPKPLRSLLPDLIYSTYAILPYPVPTRTRPKLFHPFYSTIPYAIPSHPYPSPIDPTWLCSTLPTLLFRTHLSIQRSISPSFFTPYPAQSFYNPIPFHTLHPLPFPYSVCPRGLTFTWWGCCGLCYWHKPAELATRLYSVLVSISVFMALSTVFHSMNSPDNSPLSHTVLPVSFLPCWSFQLYISFRKSFSALMQSFVVDWA